MDLDAELATTFRTAARLWNAHRFFACHDKLEEAWQLVKHEKKAERAADPRRDPIHAIILYAAAYVHWTRANATGTARKLADARRLLAHAPPRLLGLDLAAFSTAVEEDLERGARGEAYVARRVPPLVIENA